MEFSIPDQKLRKQLLSAKALDHNDIDMMNKGEYINYIKRRICAGIVRECTEGKTNFYLEIRPDYDDLLMKIFPDFERAGITLKIEDQEVKYHYTHWKNNVKYTTGEYEYFKEHVLHVSWDSDLEKSISN